MIDTSSVVDEVAQFRRRRLLRRSPPPHSGNVPAMKLDAIRAAAALVLANDVLLDAARADDQPLLDARSDEIEADVAAQSAAEALACFQEASQHLLDRLLAEPDLPVENVYPVARVASDLAIFVATEMHLIARMLDPTYVPADPRLLLHTLNGSLRSMIGHGLEDWVTERVMPWRNMVIRRGLAWP
ncbi:MAG: hypothetical protein AAGA37_15910 [Actinomycetota bacterium]